MATSDSILAPTPARPALASLDANAFPVVAVAFVTLVQLALIRHVLQSDSWLTLVGGRIVAQSGLPRHDHLAVLTRGVGWVDQQWLAQLVFYGLWSVGGVRLAALATVASFVVAFALLVAVARRAGASAIATAVGAVPCFLAAASNSVMRAQVLAYILFALLLWLVYGELLRPGRRVLLCLPLLALWANVHGSVVMAALLVALLGATRGVDALRRGGGLGVASALLVLPWPLVLASPYGTALVGYYVRVLGNPTFARFVTEWQPPTIRSQPIFFVVALAGIFMVARAGRRLFVFEHAVFALTLVAALLAVRNIVWFALFATVVLPRALAALWSPAQAARRVRVNAGIAAVATSAVLASTFGVARQPTAWWLSGFPAAGGDAVARLAAAEPSVNVFADERYADWLLWEHPELKGRVAYDARLELLDQLQMEKLASFKSRSGRHWVTATDGFRIIVPGTTDARALSELTAESDSRVVYRSPALVVLERTRR